METSKVIWGFSYFLFNIGKKYDKIKKMGSIYGELHLIVILKDNISNRCSYRQEWDFCIAS